MQQKLLVNVKTASAMHNRIAGVVQIKGAIVCRDKNVIYPKGMYMSNQKNEKHNAEYWVTQARAFGEKCLGIQQDHKLTEQQKLEKQRAFSKELAKEIENDEKLSSKDKKQMLSSIGEYLKEWQEIYLLVKENREKNPVGSKSAHGPKK
jgi:hypothetical protein